MYVLGFSMRFQRLHRVRQIPRSTGEALSEQLYPAPRLPITPVHTMASAQLVEASSCLVWKQPLFMLMGR